VGGYVNHDNSKLRASILTKLGLQVKLQLTKFWPSLLAVLLISKQSTGLFYL